MLDPTQILQVSTLLQKTAHETQFRQMERTFASRANDEIQAAIDADETPKKLKELQKKRDDLAAKGPMLEEYAFENRANIGKLGTLSTLASEGAALFATDDADATVLTEAEAAAIAERRDEIVASLNRIALLEHPDFVSDLNIRTLRNLRDDLKALTPSAGAVSDGSDNAQLKALFADIASRAEVAQETAVNTQSMTNKLKQDLQAQLSTLEATGAELTAVQAEGKIRDIEAIKEKYSQLLQAMSLSFEINSGLVDQVAKRLAKQNPEPGSILNLFG